VIGKLAWRVQSRLHYCDDSCLTSCVFADFTQYPCVALLQRSCCTGNSGKTMIGKRALLVQSRFHYCDDSCCKLPVCWFHPVSLCSLMAEIMLQGNNWNILNRPKEMNAVSTKCWCEFFLQSAHLPHPYFLKWHPGMFCTCNLI
jgi:hypothetical protein